MRFQESERGAIVFFTDYVVLCKHCNGSEENLSVMIAEVSKRMNLKGNVHCMICCRKLEESLSTMKSLLDLSVQFHYMRAYLYLF